MTSKKNKGSLASKAQQQGLSKKALKKQKRAREAASQAAQHQPNTITAPTTAPVPAVNSANAHSRQTAKPKWTGLLLIDTFYGPNLSAAPQQHSFNIVQTIVGNVQRRVSRANAIDEGRTIEYMRYKFDIRCHSLRDRLFSCFQPMTQSPDIILDRLENALRDELYYVICWNPDVFREVHSRQLGREAFPIRCPGKYTSMYDVLEAEGMRTRMLNYSTPGECAHAIFLTLLDRIRAKAPLSPVLYGAVPSHSKPNAPLLKQGEGESKKQFKLREDLAEASSESNLTLALLHENFQTGLAKIIQDAHRVCNGDPEKIRNVVEAYTYQLALKEPRAFPEVFQLSYRPSPAAQFRWELSTPPCESREGREARPFPRQLDSDVEIKEEDTDEDTEMSEGDGLLIWD